MLAPCQGFHAAGGAYNVGEVAGAWQAPIAPVGIASGYCQPSPPAHALEPAPKFFMFVPVCPAEPSMWPSAQPHSLWPQVAPCTPLNFGQFVPAVVQEVAVPSLTSIAQTPMLFASDTLNLDFDGCQQGSNTVTLPATGLCTPELTPRWVPELSPEAGSTYSQHVAMNVLPEVVAKLANYTKQSLIEQEIFAEVSSDCDSAADEADLICWDFDIHAALLIRAHRGSNGYASSETSTAPSRSARRRRGRRVAKAKAKSSMHILESPAIEGLLVTEEKKVELMRQLELGGDVMHKAVSSILGSVLRMSLEPFGCRVVQQALDVAGPAEKDALVAELRNHVRLTISSPHANFVIQKVIEVLPVVSTSFVAEELATVAAEVAQHRFGCRVLSRLVEHHLCGNSACPAANDLIDELLLETDELIHHNFARHVLDLILEHGSASHKQRIAQTIRKNIFHHAKNRCASYVVEKSLALCSAADSHAIASDLLADPEQFLMLAMHECGMHVVKAVTQTHSACVQKTQDLLLANVGRVKSSKYGKRLLDDL